MHGDGHDGGWASEMIWRPRLGWNPGGPVCSQIRHSATAAPRKRKPAKKKKAEGGTGKGEEISVMSKKQRTGNCFHSRVKGQVKKIGN
jgi:hypothetical protein